MCCDYFFSDFSMPVGINFLTSVLQLKIVIMFTPQVHRSRSVIVVLTSYFPVSSMLEMFHHVRNLYSVNISSLQITRHSLVLTKV